MTAPRLVAVLGAGEIGSGWAALFAAHGARVRIVDPDPAALPRARAALDIALDVRHAPVPDAARAAAHAAIERAPTAAAGADGADWIQESLPEVLARKREVLVSLAGHVRDDAVVASSTSAVRADDIADELPFADRVLVAHPLHPVYAVPVVELCGGRATSAAALRRAELALRAVGREPVVLRTDTPGLVANRLTAALLREATALVAEGVVGARDLDRVVSRGIATGWVAAGVFGTEAMGAGGDADAWMARMGDALDALLATVASWSTLDDARRGALRDALAAARRRTEREWADAVARAARATSP
ncbi:MAG TPA: 3-hydroxyacyl-CoA dehydrogenase NAD-binding domain-containing protein [Gemmatimonadaceae bacterium]|nr:3-hydroxyacyl-CoA dehydrogenase NAD-binding domain-containing protein [Gemmatimonadaceae bacterium]